MNPIAYCAVASCSDKDWEIFSLLLVVIVLVGFGVFLLSALESFIRKHRNKEDDMK
jgi:disulfide bond formation protein DsbB